MLDAARKVIVNKPIRWNDTAEDLVEQAWNLVVRDAPEQANAVLGPTLGFFQGLRKFTYPVCLFFFTVREEQAFFSWLAEPIVNGDGPKLVHHATANCVELTDALLGDVVDRVVAWYDAVEAALIH